MRFSSTVLLSLLPAFIAAEDQAPLKDKAAAWFDKAKAYVANAAPDVPNPIDAGASAVAAYSVDKINIRNYMRKLGPKPEGEEEWMLYIHGGNKTCHGRCQKSDTAWNESVPLLKALPNYNGAPLKLGDINCEVDEILCTAFAAAVPSIFHFIFPQQVAGAQSQAPSPLHDIPLNISGVTVEDIVSIPRASKSRYLKYDEYIGAVHPIDGVLQQYGLLTTLGWILWGFASTPSWLFMIGISFFSRQMMARKAGQRADKANAAAAGVAAQRPATAPPAAVPVSGAKGGSKKRR